jgi:hypothetical protein
VTGVYFHKKGDKTDCNNYHGKSLLLTSYKILFNILLLKLSQYIDEIIRYHQCGFRSNRSVADHIFCIYQILDKNGSIMRQYMLFIDFKKAYDLVGGKTHIL